jgi:uncharacterized membrane protein
MNQTGRIFFAMGMICLGALSIYHRDFMVGRPPGWPWTFSGWTTISGILATLLIAAGLSVLFKKNAGLAALVIGSLILLFSEVRHLLVFAADWGNTSKTLALCGGSLIVAISSFRENEHIPGFIGPGILKEKFLLTAIAPISLFMIIACVLHFMYADFVDAFIPAYIPLHTFWTYFTAIALLAGGIDILIKRTRMMAAMLSGIMIFLWFLLLHIPRTMEAPQDKGEWMGVFESLAFSGIFLVLAGMEKVRKGIGH